MAWSDPVSLGIRLLMLQYAAGSVARAPNPLIDNNGALQAAEDNRPALWDRASAEAWNFALPTNAPHALGLAEIRYLCASIDTGAAAYIDLMSEALRQERRFGNATDPHNDSAAARMAANDFPGRFRIIYREGQAARLRADARLSGVSAGDRQGAMNAPNATIATNATVTADLKRFTERLQGIDRFFAALGRVRDTLYRSISPRSPAAQQAAVRAFIDAQMDTHVDRARSPLAEGVGAMRFAPDSEVLLRRVRYFQACWGRDQKIILARINNPHPAPILSEINRFFSANSSHLMGTQHNPGTLPNLPAKESLFEGTLTFLGFHGIDNALKFAPRAHQATGPNKSRAWKYGPQLVVDSDMHNRIPIKQIRFHIARPRSTSPFAMYQDIELRAGQYRIDGRGPWLKNPYPENEDIEMAKYLRVTALIAAAGRERTRILHSGEAHDPRDYTGNGPLIRFLKWLGLLSLGPRVGDRHGN